jgi:hypothetical protein
MSSCWNGSFYQVGVTVEGCKALTPSPSPVVEGNKKIIWVLLLFFCGRRGWGMRVPRNISCYVEEIFAMAEV